MLQIFMPMPAILLMPLRFRVILPRRDFMIFFFFFRCIAASAASLTMLRDAADAALPLRYLMPPVAARHFAYFSPRHDISLTLLTRASAGADCRFDAAFAAAAMICRRQF